MSPIRGQSPRAPAGERTPTLSLRATLDERARWDAAAVAAEISLSAWLRRVANARAAAELAPCAAPRPG